MRRSRASFFQSPCRDLDVLKAWRDVGRALAISSGSVVGAAAVGSWRSKKLLWAKVDVAGGAGVVRGRGMGAAATIVAGAWVCAGVAG